MHAAQYQPGQLLPGTVYRVVRHLATGGMGSVYDVEDVTVEKRYVLKTLHPNLVEREDLALRMRTEAKSLAKLQHPNIVDVVTAGVTNEAPKIPFYVMERLVGQNLRVVLDKMGALQAAHAYRIAIDVADALEHAHEKNVVHRDVKPENIFLHRNVNGATITKLLDFGIVRLLDRKASQTHGRFIGTLRYASPEQIEGRAIGPATDIYSLGVVLFEMLAGRGPFDEAGDAYAVGLAHASAPPPPLSRFLRGVAPGVERLVASALAKDPAERPRDCFAFASALRGLLHEEEASPRTSTAVNLLTSASHATEAQTDAPTVEEMIPPSVLATEISQTAQTVTTGPAHHDGGEGGPVSPVAPTVAADGSVRPSAQPVTPVIRSPAPIPAAGTPAGQARVVDRNAVTREGAPLGQHPRVAPNDTQLEPEAAAPRQAGGESGAAPTPPAPIHHASRAAATVATRRRPEHGPLLLLGVAAALAIAMVGAALVAVKKPWKSSLPAAASAAAASAGTGIAVPTPTGP